MRNAVCLAGLFFFSLLSTKLFTETRQNFVPSLYDSSTV